jgi:ubiquinol-cytochrome c reductase cytochrome c1 subunit
MPKMLNDDAVEYEDGTPATEAQVTILFLVDIFSTWFVGIAPGLIVLICITQMGKDVVSFLSWAAEPEMEERKLVSSQLICYSCILA